MRLSLRPLRSNRSTRRGSPRRGAVPLLLLAASVALLAGCATGGAGAGKDIVTQSDKTELDRRADIHMDLAREYYKNKQFTTAIDEVKQALAARPDRPDAYMLRGLAYWGLGDNRTADESFRRSIELKPGDADTLSNYGWFLCQTRRFPEADAQFVAAVQVPNYAGVARVTFLQGVCQADAGDLASAEKTLSHAYELDPASPFTAYNLALVLYKRGQYDRARFYVRRINVKDDLVSAQSLWLAARIERKLGDDGGVQALGNQLRQRFPQAPETQAFDKGRFDD